MASRKIKSIKKLHIWRMCPIGEHWVSAHPLHTKARVSTRRGHCRTNPSKKDQLYPDEMLEIAQSHFGRLKKLPAPIKLGATNGNDYDRIIAGWTKYWNEVLDPKDPLDSNLVKALISTETDFRRNKKVLASKRNWARGLMQVTDETINILKDESGELKDFLVNLDENKAYDPNLNICAGIRWLFHKKKLLESRLGRAASWEEAAMEYKSYTQGIKKADKSAILQRNKFLDRYGRLKGTSK
jgi:hypothetical protein